MLEKLVPGDRVIKIPLASDIVDEDSFPKVAPNGASAVVIEGEDNFTTANLDTGERYRKYGCIILYDNPEYSSPTLDGQWFRERKGLMKINPDVNLIVEEIAEDALRKQAEEKILTLDEVIELAKKLDKHI